VVGFDLSDIQEEFEIIAELGLTLIRIFLLWESWQAAPNTVNRGALDNLEQVCDIAADLGL